MKRVSEIVGVSDADSTTELQLFPVGAIVHKGAAKRKIKGVEVAGENQPFFRVEFLDRAKKHEAAFRKRYGDKPVQFDNVRLFATLGATFPNSMVDFFINGSLRRVCDHQTIHLDWGPGGWDHTPKPCQFSFEADQGCTCRQRGQLYFFLPDLINDLGLEDVSAWFCFKLSTGDLEEIGRISGHLRFIQKLAGSLYNVPFTLWREEGTHQAPVKDKKSGEMKPAQVKSYPVHILADMADLLGRGLPGAPGGGLVLPPNNPRVLTAGPGSQWVETDGQPMLAPEDHAYPTPRPAPEEPPAPRPGGTQEPPAPTGGPSPREHHNPFGHPPKPEEPKPAPWWPALLAICKAKLEIDEAFLLESFEAEDAIAFCKRITTFDAAKTAVLDMAEVAAWPIRVNKITVRELKDNPANHCYVVDAGLAWVTAFERKPFVEGGVIQDGDLELVGTYTKPDFYIFVERKTTEDARTHDTKTYWQITEAAAELDDGSFPIDQDDGEENIPF